AITDLPLEAEMPTAGAHDVVVDNFSFAPAMASVPVGTVITWTNRDDVPHTIVSTEQKFKSPVLDTDGQFAHRFDAPGTYKYFCSIHPKMTGQVEVGRGTADHERIKDMTRFLPADALASIRLSDAACERYAPPLSS